MYEKACTGRLAARGGEGSRVCILSKTELFVLRSIMAHGAVFCGCL